MLLHRDLESVAPCIGLAVTISAACCLEELVVWAADPWTMWFPLRRNIFGRLTMDRYSKHYSKNGEGL